MISPRVLLAWLGLRSLSVNRALVVAAYLAVGLDWILRIRTLYGLNECRPLAAPL